MPIAKANHRHRALADMMVCYPRLKLGEIAEMLGYTQAWLSQVISSDAFKEVYSDRLRRHQDMQSGETILRVQEVANLSLDAMADKVRKQGEQLPMSDLRENASMALAALGFTGGAAPAEGGGQPPVQINIGANVEVIEKARQRRQQTHEAQLIEHEAVEADGSKPTTIKDLPQSPQSEQDSGPNGSVHAPGDRSIPRGDSKTEEGTQ